MINDVTVIGIIKEKEEHNFTIEVITSIYVKDKGETNISQLYTCYIENNTVLDYIEINDNVMIKSSFIGRKEPYNTDLLVYSINKIGADLDNICYFQSLIFHGRINTPTESVTTNGKPRLSFSLAITKRIINKSEEPVTIWVNITLYQQSSIDLFKSLLPGSSVIVTGGRLQIRSDLSSGKVYSEVICYHNHILVSKHKVLDSDSLDSSSSPF